VQPEKAGNGEPAVVGRQVRFIFPAPFLDGGTVCSSFVCARDMIRGSGRGDAWHEPKCRDST